MLGGLVAIALLITLYGRYGRIGQEPRIKVSLEGSSASPLPEEPMLRTVDDLSATDLDAIQAVISQQMAAFQAGDADAAFAFASPDIQARFQTPQQFMAMVQSAYAAVYQPQSVNFEGLEVINGQPIQAVTVLGAQGEWVTAYYQMEQQADQTWRIAGCLLMPLGGETI